jgi:hypothetical protein
MEPQQFGQVRRSLLLFALEDDLEIEAWPLPLGAKRVDRRENGHDARFIVGSASGVNPRVGAVADQFRLEGRSDRPVLRRHRLTVIMGVEHIGSRSPGDAPLTVDEGRRRSIGIFEHTRGKSAALHHPDDMVGIPPDVGEIVGHVGNGEQG